MNGRGESDSLIVSEKPPNKGRGVPQSAEEGREGGWPRGIWLSKPGAGRRTGEPCKVRSTRYDKRREGGRMYG
jgi:hypothetical protein